jgi:hypothetical protein
MMATFTEQSDQVVDLILARNAEATTALNQLNSAIYTTRSAIESGIAQLLSNGININLSSMQFIVDKLTSVTVSTVTSPTMPTQGTVSIGDTEWARIQALAAAELARSGVTEEAAAASEAALRGLSVPSVIATGMVSFAQQRIQDRLSLAALQNAVEHAKAKREDVIRIAELDIKKFAEDVRSMLETYKAQHEVNRGYEVLEQEYQKILMESIVAPEKLRAEYDLKKTELSMNNAVGQLVDLIQVNAQVTNALLTSSDVGLGSSVSLGVSYPFKYNPTDGDVVINAL